jgi:hypothetical protein
VEDGRKGRKGGREEITTYSINRAFRQGRKIGKLLRKEERNGGVKQRC